MTQASGPDWLAQFQAEFGAVIRTPLDRSTGSLRAQVDAYAAGTVDAVPGGPHGPSTARLAVYNRQYWFRLFGVMQSAFPLTSRLMGLWAFNAYSADFLVAHPPRTWNLDAVPDGFERALDMALEGHPDRTPWVQAARIDAAWRSLFHAPEEPVFRPSLEDGPRLLDARLEPSAAAVCVEEDWPLLDLKNRLDAHPGEAAIPLPEKLPRTQAWLLVRETHAVRYVPLDPGESLLLALLRDHPVRDALGRLEALCPASERQRLPALVQTWLSRSVERGMWRGLLPASTA